MGGAVRNLSPHSREPLVTYRARRAEPAPAGPGGLASFVAFLLMAAAALAVVLSGVLYALGGVLLTPARWLDALDASGAYERAPAAVAEQVVARVDSLPANQPRTLAPLDRSDVEAIVITLVPPDWLRGQAQAVIPALVSGVTATGQVRAVVSLEALKTRFTSGPLLATVLDRIATWPACTQEQLQSLAAGVLSRCLPPQTSMNVLALALAGLFSVVATELPSSVDLANPGPAPGSGALAASGLTDALRLAATARSFVPALVTVVVVSLLVATLLAGRTRRRALVTWCVPLLLGGLALLAIGVVVDPVLATGVSALRTSLAAGGMAPGLVAIAGSAAAAMVDRTGWLLVEVGAPLVAVSLAGLVLASLLPGRRG
jgi:hypothetical protein